MSASSYFDGLVARARGEAPLLTPRRTSRFEPGSPAEGATLEPEGQVSEAPGPPAQPAWPRQVPPVRKVSERSPSPAPERQFEREPQPSAEDFSRGPRASGRPRSEPVQDVPPRYEQKPADDSPPRTVERELRETHIKELRVERVLPAARERESNRRPQPEKEEKIAAGKPPPSRDNGARVPALDEIDQRLKALEQGGANGDAGPPAGAEPAVQEAIREARPAATPHRVVAPAVRKAAGEKSRPPAVREPGPAPGEPEPVVQVSIGRIEVRASAPDKPVRTPGPAKPRLSLDDYLRQREGK